MALVKVSEILKMADEANTSVIAFNCVDYSQVHAVCTVAEELGKPVLIALYPGHSTDFMCTVPEGFAPMAIYEANRVSVPVGLHLDHCSDMDYIKRAIDLGFSSIMYDGSMLPMEENIANTKAVVEYAHARGVDVEGELGCVGSAANEEDQSNVDMYTKPEDAKRFCEETGCDAIAVSIGSAHGFYTKTPKLDLERLQQINAATDVPLVLHGGSGIPDDQLEKAFTMGINKFNVGTEFFRAHYEAVAEFVKANEDNKRAVILDVPVPAQEALKNYLREKMLLTKM